MVRKNTKILFAAQDPGGFNALLPVFLEFKKRGVNCLMILAGQSRLLAKRQRIKFKDGSLLTAKKIASYLKDEDVDCVVVGTSDGLSLDKRVTSWAKSQGLPSLAIIDFWSVDHRERFSSPQVLDHRYEPDVICVIDELMKRRLISEGFRPRKIKITGNPFFSIFKQPLPSGGRYLLFICQPFSEIYSKLDKLTGQPDFNEVQILADYLKLFRLLKIRQPIKIALHPRTIKKNKFDHLKVDSLGQLEIVQTDTYKLIPGAFLIFGINSVILFQAALQGKKVVSYQPGITKQQDILMSNRLGLSYSAYNLQQLKIILGRCFSRKLKNPEIIRRRYVSDQPKLKILRVIEQLVN